MRLLVLGAGGMLGHKVCQVLSPTFDVTGTIRHDPVYMGVSPFGAARIVLGIDALDTPRLERLIEEVSPDVVINCIGIIKQLRESEDRLLSVWINSLLPHQIYHICQRRGTRLIHVSTDCVFSGQRGNYREDDPSDAEDIYGKTKYLGEVAGEGALTIRTSLIGREISTSNGLVEWFLSNREASVNGFTNVIFSGFPTLQFASIISEIIAEHWDLSGIYHVSSEPISKFKLLTLLRDKIGIEVAIQEYPDFYCDRSLDSTFFRNKTGFQPPSWERMVEGLVQDAQQYKQWRTV